MAVGGFDLPGDLVLKQIIWDVVFFLIPGSGIFVVRKLYGIGLIASDIVRDEDCSASRTLPHLIPRADCWLPSWVIKLLCGC